ncbi:MAG: type VI secretion system tip protein VgrG, partial [Thioploca sp.]|nr:type VI secretion system tip protein VgrG [Thioploca sp.]
GKGWGHIAIPRIGQEVIVSFLNGNPDTPIVTGAVYNASQTVPYPLPAEQTKSTLKSNSSKGGAPYSNYNEIRFEDKVGNEELYIQAEKDRNELVKNDMSTQVKANQSLTVGKNQTEMVGLNKAETIGIAKALTIGAAYQISVGAAMNTTVALSQSEQVGKIKNVLVGDKIAFKCGDSSITLEKDGTIKIKGVKIDIEGCGVVTIRGNPLHLNPDPPKKDNEEQCLAQASQEGTSLIEVSE